VRRVVIVAGVIIASAGLLLTLFPVISVWQLSGQVLGELPPISALDASDDHRRLAISDREFILAVRTYEDAEAATITSALLADGFQPIGVGTQRWLSKDCCGSYDAVWVRVEDTGSGSAIATVTVADSDVQLSWPFFAIVGLPLMLGGGIAAVVGLRGPSEHSTDTPIPIRSGTS
jgi:hypothetical protein